MTNTSATGGPLVPSPAPAPAPLEGRALYSFIQATLVGISGIVDSLVRARFQTEDTNYPNTGTCWMSFSITHRPADTFPVITHQGSVVPDDPAFLGQDNFQKQERLVVLCSFYDDGVQGNAMGAAAQTRDGFQIPQNMEALGVQKIALVAVGDILPVPVMIKTQWVFRCDLEVVLTRQVDRVYPILNLVEVPVTINNEFYEEDILVEK